MPRLPRIAPEEVKQGAARVNTMLQQIEKRYAADMFSPNMAAAYVLYLIKVSHEIDVEDLSAFLKAQLGGDSQLIDWIKMHIGGHWNDFRRLIATVPAEWLREYLLTHQPTTSRESDTATPESLCDLAARLINGFGGERICDPCCGIGNFMTRIAATDAPLCFEGHDLADRCVCISKIRAAVLGLQAKISKMNTLEAEVGIHGPFDNIFIEPPFGQRLTNIHSFFNNQEGALPPAFPMVKGTNSTEWIWASKALEALGNNGHVVIVVSNGALFNMTEAPLRQYMIDRGYVECVIALPDRMLNYSSVGLSMVILSKKGSSSVRMIDARTFCRKEARANVMTPENVAAVVEAFNAQTTSQENVSKAADNWLDVPNADIAQNNYQLSVPRYFMPKVQVDGGRRLREVCEITRGAPLTREDLHEKRVDGDTGFQCLTIANVQDGIVDKDLPFIDGVGERERKFLVQNGDIVLTKAMAPYKVAVVEKQDNANILATGNFFILHLDRGLIDPYFLMAYLLGEEGRMQIDTVATGTTIRTIVQNSLENMTVPVPSLEEQRAIGQKYKEHLLALAEKRKEYESAKKELDGFYEDFKKRDKE